MIYMWKLKIKLKPFYNQQVKAKKYLDISDKLKTMEVNSYIREIEELENN